jgi:hypothetical protein
MSNSIVLVARQVLCIGLILTTSATPLLAQRGLKITVVEGQGAIQNVSRPGAFEPVVEVTDSTGRAVTGAAVTFTLPAVGPGGVFTDGSRSLMTHTDASGRATARGFRPNRNLGPYEIRVTAAADGQAGSAVISQTNAAPADAERGSAKKWAIVLGIVGGAVAAGAVAAAGAGGQSTAARPTTPSDPPAGSVTPGTPGFGPPR